MTEVRRMPAPWTVVPLSSSFRIDDAQGKSVAYVYFYDDHARNAAGPHALNVEEARRVARAIARLPTLLKGAASPPEREASSDVRADVGKSG